MITVKHKSTKPLNPKLGESRRYVRRDIGSDGYSYCIKQARSWYDYEQGTCDAIDLPEAVQREADAQCGMVYGYVEWPL
jgi:hypothetical protein